MKQKINIIELFSGIGGFSKGLEQAGFEIEKHYFSEIDKHAIANYKYNYPNAKYIGSVIDIRPGDFRDIDIITFGFPCQDLSLAGKRLGFKGKRSSLFYHATRILRETQTKCFIYENVKGLLSSNNGQDMEAVCEELYLSGYVYDFEIQNTKWFIPQNRERVYCVGYNIKYLQKWILNNQSGQNQKYDLFKRIISSWVQMKYQKFLTEVLKQSEQRQKELVLEYYFLKEQRMFNGQNLRKRLSEIINSLQLENWKDCYQGVLQLLLKQCDISSDLSMIQKLNLLQEDIKLCGTKEEMERKKSYLSIEKLLKMILEENLQEMNKYIILTLINSTTQSKIFSYAEMQLNIELFIIQLNLLYPNCWKEVLSDLIEQQRNTNYEKIRSDEIKNTKKNNNSSIQLSIFKEFGDSVIGHFANRSEPGVFPISENDARIDERTIETRSIRTLTAGGNSGGLHSSMTLVKTLQGSDTLNTIRSGGRGSLTDKHSWDIVQVKSATSKGFEIASEGDSINLSNPNSETRRGRVGKGVAQTLDCSCNQAVIGAFRGRNPENPKSRESGLPTEQMLEINKEGVSNTLTSVQKDNVVITQKPRGNNKGADFEICPTISANSFEHNNHIDNIRRLTEIECERLQGFPDNWTRLGIYEKQVWINKKEGTFKIVQDVQKIPKTQRYKMLGNAVTVKVVEEIAKRLKIN